MESSCRIVVLNLPVDHWWEELRNETFVVWPEFLGIARFITLAIKVIGVERLNRLKGLLILLVAKVGVSTLTMPPM